MSQENVEIVRAAIDAHNRGDVDGTFKDAAPDFQYDQTQASASTVARGRDGIEVQARGIWVWTFRDGACVRITLYQEREEALEAAGLSE
jgi:ketosteroid isomerase-like protein